MFDVSILIHNKDSIFWGFSGPEFDKLIRLSERKKFSHGQEILKSRFRSDSFAILVSGSIHLTQGEFVLRQVLPGGIIGDTEFFLGFKRNFQVRFVEDGEVIIISRKAIDNFFREIDRDLETEVLSNIIKKLSANLSKSNRQIADLLNEKNEAVEILRDELISLSENSLILKKDFDFFYAALNSLKINFEHEFFEEKRRAKRFKINKGLNFKIISDLFFEMSDLIDLSEKGFKAEIGDFPHAEVSQIITGQILRDFVYFCDFSGEIRWLEGNLVGIEFVNMSKGDQKKIIEIVKVIDEAML